MLRVFDIFFSSFGIILLMPILLLITLIVYFETKHPIFTQTRLGRNKKSFILIKFRTMKINTPNKGSHLIDSSYITKTGSFLRVTKIDELPQLWNVLCGEMSIVGPRPCLPNQYELIIERQKRRVFDIRPGITGLAQIKTIDMATPKLLARTDAVMIKNLNLRNYFKYIFFTVLGKGFGDQIEKRK